ncbi:hypothetical protein HanPI659440_Chr12g0457791 [Helianthus annuus]|nr:hypothetical protein HanPI659440_Chr12g0457791 [Helianthus annuus]
MNRDEAMTPLYDMFHRDFYMFCVFKVVGIANIRHSSSGYLLLAFEMTFDKQPRLI